MSTAPTHLQLNPAQQEVVDRGLLASGFSCVLQMPTGSGKTWLAEQAIAAALQRGQRALYLTPLRALAEELVGRWRKRFGDFPVGVFTGEYGVRTAYPVPFERARLLVMTPERLDACTRQWRAHWTWIPDVSLVVVDELHLLGDEHRGPRLEGALMRLRRLNPFAQLLGLSATLGNREELTEWLSGVHFESRWRPVPLKWHYVRFQKATDKPRLLKAEVERCLAAGGQSLVFVQSRRRAEALARELTEAGISTGHHHAGLGKAERSRTEGDFRAGAVRVLVSTGTLEMGLNLPARQVVLYDLQGFDGEDYRPLPVNSVWQRAGRAGRPGLDPEGEVVLLVPAWDRTATRYEAGRFEPVASGLASPRALAEQVLAEVASGLARTPAQLARALDHSLAAHQARLAPVERTLAQMLAAGMLREVASEEGRPAMLQATRLGRVAVRHMLAPATVEQLSTALRSETARDFSLFDLLLLCAASEDCEPRLPVDFEELEELGALLSEEQSLLLASPSAARERFLPGGRQLLVAVKMALVARRWTRLGEADEVARRLNCYPYEVVRLSESLLRLLTAARAVLEPEADKPANTDLPRTDDALPLRERLGALATMVEHGLDEEAATLTFVPGIGGTYARRLCAVGIGHLEALAQAEPSEVRQVQGVSAARAQRWVDHATALLNERSAFSLREVGQRISLKPAEWPVDVDPYRLRRALELRVRRLNATTMLVTGGLEPHRIRTDAGRMHCDCADHGRGYMCKHLLAVRIHHKDPTLPPALERLRTGTAGPHLDLLELWFQGARQ